MGISKITLVFVILGLAYCSGDSCSQDVLITGLQMCGDTVESFKSWWGPNSHSATNKAVLKKACSVLEEFYQCFADATNGCEAADLSIFTSEWKRVEGTKKDCVRLGYSHASSTSVANIVSLIAALATLVPFV